MQISFDAQAREVTVPFVVCLMFLALAPLTARADLSAKQARSLIQKTAGMSLPSSSVRVQKPVMVNPNVAEASAELDLVFRFVTDTLGGWRIAEVRTGQGRWEEIELITRSVGGKLSSTECNSTGGFPKPAGDLTSKRARCLVAELFGIAL